MLPDRVSTSYNFRPRPHDRQLAAGSDNRNFIVYNNVYFILFISLHVKSCVFCSQLLLNEYVMLTFVIT